MHLTNTGRTKISKEEITLQDYIWASGTYLTTHLPEGFDKWEKKKKYSFLEEFAHESVEGLEGKDIWEMIEDLAWSVRMYIDYNVSVCMKSTADEPKRFAKWIEEILEVD